MATTEKFTIASNLAFPSQLTPFDEKKTNEWGLNLARAIESEWFYKATPAAKCRFFTQREDFAERRLYSKGMQSTKKYKEKLGLNGDLSYLNLSDKPISIIPKLVNIVCNGMANREASIKAFSIDPTSIENRVKYRQSLEDERFSMDIIDAAKEKLGVDIANFPKEDVPENNEELDMHMQLNYKQSIEKSEELAISAVFEENSYAQTIENRVTEDIVVCGIGWAKHKFIEDRGIVLEYVDCENKIQNYTTDPFFRDCFYHGEIKEVLTSDLLIEFPWLNEDPNAKSQLDNSSTVWWEYHQIQQNERLRGTSSVMYFTYKTTRERAKKIKTLSSGGKILKEITSSKATPKKEYDNVKFVTKVDEVLFEGAYLLGTNILLEWKVCEYLARPKSNSQKVIDVYVGVAPEINRGYIDSLVARMIPIEDKLNILELKAEQIIQRIMPDGYRIDPMAIADIDLGEGVMSPQQVFDMFFETGTILATAYNSSGDFNYGKDPITELRTGDSLGKLQALRGERDGYMNLIRDVIGLNKASDASTPDKDALVGLQKMAALNSNVATRHILYARNDVTLRLANGITYRVADLLKYSNLREDFVRKIGMYSVEDLEYVKDLHLYDFSIFLELTPDDEENAKFEADLSVEISKNMLDTSDKYKIMAIKNLKLRSQYLTILKKKRERRLLEMDKEKFKAQSDENIRASQAAEQFKQQTAQIEAQTKAQIQKMVTDGEIQKELVRGEETRKSLEIEYNRKIELQYVVNSGQVQKTQETEDRKDERSREQATQASEMIKQRETNGQPKDFKADNLDMDAFQLPADGMM